jgi:two-component system chemotaxis sensor kinase CheA
MVNKLVRSLETSYPGNKDIGHLAELLEEMHKINSGMQARLVDLRKAPLSNVLRPLPRTVRDLSRQLGKDIVLTMRGDDLRVDTTIGQALSDSLIHLIRNSVDHGIEPAADRRAAGKPAQGSVAITCQEQGEEILIELADDGRGIDPAVIRAKAVEKGLLKTEAAAALSNTEAMQFIFESGFSTAKQISDVSGRGVGMDMVRTAVRALNGDIEVRSQRGEGTTFVLRLPTPKSVLIINSLLLVSDDQTFAMPQDQIVRLLRLDGGNDRVVVVDCAGAKVLQDGDRILPIVDLRRVLAQAPRAAAQAGDVQSVVLVKSKRFEYALLVDAILDGEEIVVKPIGPHLASLQTFAGATFLGDGSVGLILDVDGIAQVAALAGEATSQRAHAEATVADDGLELLLMRTTHPGLFGVPLAQVHRIEEMRPEDVRWALGQCVMNYRGGIMPIYELDELLALGRADRPTVEARPIVVVEHEERFLGIAVREIADVARTLRPIDTQARDRPQLAGSVFVGEEPASVVDLYDVLAQKGIVERPRPARTVEAPSISSSPTPVAAPAAALTPAPAAAPAAAAPEPEEKPVETAAWGLF